MVAWFLILSNDPITHANPIGQRLTEFYQDVYITEKMFSTMYRVDLAQLLISSKLLIYYTSASILWIVVFLYLR